MKRKEPPGLGELLRYVGELVEQGAEERYAQLNLRYRARYTPVLRALSAGAETVTEITARSRLTQGAISQSVGLMESDGLLSRYSVADGRKTGVRLTAAGRALVERLEPHWAVTFRAIAELEKEIGHPLRQVLEDAARALEQRGFAERLAAAERRRTEVR
jgi:MarR family transcriptional regulator, organic hydroperoxide resistance regulator